MVEETTRVANGINEDAELQRVIENSMVAKEAPSVAAPLHRSDRVAQERLAHTTSATVLLCSNPMAATAMRISGLRSNVPKTLCPRMGLQRQRKPHALIRARRIVGERWSILIQTKSPRRNPSRNRGSGRPTKRRQSSVRRVLHLIS